VPGPDERRLDPESLANHVGRLYRAAYALCGSAPDAEDLVQDTFERVLRRPRFLRNRDHDLAYLLRVMRNTWISSGRAQRPQTVALEPAELAAVAMTPTDPVVADVVEGGAVYAALGGLSEPLRETVAAVDIVGLSYREAAHALGCEVGTIMSRLYRARAQLAAALQAER
jgi:RNA polymerase sigma-70 factor (ECF subfamily)